jgi:anti-anti-sigma regulatory factor
VTVKFTVESDIAGLVASMSGSLTLADVGDVRTSLLKCLAEQPDALLVDISGLTVIDPMAPTVFAAVNRQAGRWPGIPVVFFGSGPAADAMLRAAAFRRMTTLPSLASARERVLSRTIREPGAISEELLPVSGAARHARDVVTDACLRWDLPHLVAPASLVVTELVGNAVDHAHTMMTLRITRWERYFFIAVRDGSTQEPKTDVKLPEAYTVGGRGLYLVDATAHSWGCLPARDGKVVWASLLTATP